MSVRVFRRRDDGFALLIVFLLAAAVAFTMYQEIPRIGFESQRDKEQLLIDRGGEYKRAIQVYYAENKKYPPALDDLDKNNANNRRFLRRRYKDPMTGKDEWRLIHTNGSYLTDSLVQKPPAQQNASNGTPGGAQGVGGGPLGANNMNTAAAAPPPQLGPDGQPIPAAVNAAVLRRPSDRGVQTPGVVPASPPGDDNSPQEPPVDFSNPNALPPITIATPDQPNGAPVQVTVSGQAPGQPPAVIPGFGGLQNQPGAQNQAGLPNPLGQNANGQANQFAPNQIQPAPPGQQGVTAQNALNQIFGQNQQLGGPANNNGANGLPPFAGAQNGQFQPNSGIPGQNPGLGGANPLPTGATNPNAVTIGPDGQLVPLTNQNPAAGTPLNAFAQGGITTATNNPNSANNPNNGQANATALIQQQLLSPGLNPVQASTSGSPGIAGVATTFEGASIKSYKKRTKYQEWEFVFDPAQNAPANGQPANGQQANGQQPGGLNGQPNGGSLPGGAGNSSGGADPFAPTPLFGSGSSSGTSSPQNNAPGAGGNPGGFTLPGFGPQR